MRSLKKRICLRIRTTISKNSLKKRSSSNQALLGIISGCLVIYILIQLGTLLGSKIGLLHIFHNEVPAAPSYIPFLVSVISPRTNNLDMDCIFKLQANRSFMSKVEGSLRSVNSNPKFIQYLNETLSKCIKEVEKPDEQWATTMTIPASTTTLNYESRPCLIDIFRYLKDNIALNLDEPPPTMRQIGKKYPQLKIGGHYPGPKFCRPRYSVAVIIPYRDRDAHLRFWLFYTLETLIKQQIEFNVFVAEQNGDGVFNKGQLMNTAFKWITENQKGIFHCFIFHDVDMIPENAANIYKCSGMRHVMHLSPLVSKFNYTASRKVGVTVGGAVSFNEWQFRAVNGYSNEYWGWGGEDDDMNLRIRYLGFRRLRPSFEIGRYKMIRHRHDQLNPLNTQRHKLLKKTRNSMFMDGLTSLNTTVKQVTLLRTHTLLLIEVSHYIVPEAPFQTTAGS